MILGWTAPVCPGITVPSGCVNDGSGSYTFYKPNANDRVMTMGDVADVAVCELYMCYG